MSKGNNLKTANSRVLTECNFCSLEQTPDEREENHFTVLLSGRIWGKSPKEITLPDDSTVGVDLSFVVANETYSFQINS